MRKLFFTSFLIVGFILAIVIGKVYFSKTIIVTKEVRVSAFPEGINLGELCEGYYGSYANELKEKAETNAYNYEEGIKEGMKKSIYW